MQAGIRGSGAPCARPAHPRLRRPGRGHVRDRRPARAHGLGPASRVALLVENGPEAASAFLALARAAAVAPLNPAYRAQELAFYLEDIRADAVVVDATLDSPARDVAAERGIGVLELKVDPIRSGGCVRHRRRLPGCAVRDRPDPDAVALLLHTSGTTARPKLVPLTHRQPVPRRDERRGDAGALVPSDRCLNVMPLFHIHGLVAALLASLSAGASVACSPRLPPAALLRMARRARPDLVHGRPDHARGRPGPGTGPADTVGRQRLRFIRSSSAALPVPVLEGLEATFGVPVVEAYGMTEAAHQMASNPLPPGAPQAGHRRSRQPGLEIADPRPGGPRARPGRDRRDRRSAARTSSRATRRTRRRTTPPSRTAGSAPATRGRSTTRAISPCGAG